MTVGEGDCIARGVAVNAGGGVALGALSIISSVTTEVSARVGVAQMAEKSAISSTSDPKSANTGKAPGKKVNGN